MREKVSSDEDYVMCWCARRGVMGEYVYGGRESEGDKEAWYWFDSCDSDIG